MKKKGILEFWEIRARQNRISGSWGDPGGKLENNLSQTGYNHKVCKYAERIIKLWEVVVLGLWYCRSATYEDSDLLYVSGFVVGPLRCVQRR